MINAMIELSDVWMELSPKQRIEVPCGILAGLGFAGVLWAVLVILAG